MPTGSKQSTPPPFASLDFPDRRTLYPHECANALGVSERHIIDLIDEGVIMAVEVTGLGNTSGRRSFRIPRDAWVDFLNKRKTA